MFKFLLILILLIYVFYKTAGFLFKIVFGNLRSDPGSFQQRQQHYSKKAPNSNLNIDNVPQHKTNNKSGFDGGEYVDYEEVK